VWDEAFPRLSVNLIKVSGKSLFRLRKELNLTQHHAAFVENDTVIHRLKTGSNVQTAKSGFTSYMDRTTRATDAIVSLNVHDVH